MTNALSPSVLAELVAAEQAATPGPWMPFVDPPSGLNRPTGVEDAEGKGVCYDALNGYDAELIALMRNALPALLAAAEAVEELRSLLAEFVDDDPCWFDHHGDCQAHGFALEQGVPYPMKRAREAVRGLRAQPEGATP